MRYFLGTTLFIMSTGLLACPSLEGDYLSCKTTSPLAENPRSLIIFENMIDGKKVYNMVNDDFKSFKYVVGAKQSFRDDLPEEGVQIVSDFIPMCTEKTLSLEVVSARAERGIDSNISDEDLEMFNEMAQNFSKGVRDVYSLSTEGNLTITSYLADSVVNVTTCYKF